MKRCLSVELSLPLFYRYGTCKTISQDAYILQENIRKKYMIPSAFTQSTAAFRPDKTTEQNGFQQISRLRQGISNEIKYKQVYYVCIAPTRALGDRLVFYRQPPTNSLAHHVLGIAYLEAI